MTIYVSVIITTDMDKISFAIPTFVLFPSSNNSFLNHTSASSHYAPNINLSQYLYFTHDNYNHSQSQYCGRLWLYKHHHILLSITNKHHFITNNHRITVHPQQHTEQMVIIEQINIIDPSFNCSDLTIFVRISGTETLGGLAHIAYNINHECFWFYKFNITLAGNYSIVARLLYYKGVLDFDNNKCRLRSDAGWKSSNSNITAQEAYNHPELFDDPLISTRLDWRLQFYDRHYSCCEWCSRLPLEICSKWMSGPGFDKRNDRCNMFRDDSSRYNTYPNNQIMAIEMPKEKGLTQWFAGIRRHEATTWYLGSKLSVTPSQRLCFSGNWCNYDLIHNSNFSFIVYNNEDNDGVNKDYLQLDDALNTLPFCSLQDIDQSEIFGRWITSKYYVHDHSVGCIEGKYFDEYNDTEIIESSYFCLIASYQYMWHKTYRRWPSSLWLPYTCKLKWLYSVKEAIDSIMKQGVKKIYFTGDSIPRDLQNTLYKMAPDKLTLSGSEHGFCRDGKLKITNGKLLLCYNRAMQQFVASAKPQIIVENSNLLHQLWHYNVSYIEQEIDNNLRMYNEWIEREYIGDDIWPMKLFVNAPLIVAEREYHVTGPRAVVVNRIVLNKCRKYKWFILPYFDLSEAQMYDSSREGMHPEGPVVMELIRLFFHMVFQFTA